MLSVQTVYANTSWLINYFRRCCTKNISQRYLVSTHFYSANPVSIVFILYLRKGLIQHRYTDESMSEDPIPFFKHISPFFLEQNCFFLSKLLSNLAEERIRRVYGCQMVSPEERAVNSRPVGSQAGYTGTVQPHQRSQCILLSVVFTPSIYNPNYHGSFWVCHLSTLY